MKKLFALLMALTMTVQLVTPAWADAVEEGPEETTEAVEVVEETTEATEETEVPEETEETEATEEVTEEVTEETVEETTEAEPTEETEEALPEAGVVEDVAALEAGVVASGTCGENLTWVLDEDGTLMISGEGEMQNYYSPSNAPWYGKRIEIAAVVVELGVTSIGVRAFSECENLTNVNLPESVICIGNAAFFDCKALTDVYIPDCVTEIGDSVFSVCRC